LEVIPLVRLLPWLPLAALLTGATASAQQPPPPAREHQERRGIVPEGPDEPVPGVEGVRPLRTVEALEARLAQVEAELAALKSQCARSGLPQLAFSGLLDAKDVRATPFRGEAAPGDRSGLKPGKGIGYRATLWALVVVEVRNLPGQPAWAPGTARLTSATGTPVKVLSVHPEKPRLQAGESTRLAVWVEPPVSPERFFRLELVDTEGGRLFSIIQVEL